MPPMPFSFTASARGGVQAPRRGWARARRVGEEGGGDLRTRRSRARARSREGERNRTAFGDRAGRRPGVPSFRSRLSSPCRIVRQRASRTLRASLTPLAPCLTLFPLFYPLPPTHSFGCCPLLAGNMAREGRSRDRSAGQQEEGQFGKTTEERRREEGKGGAGRRHRGRTRGPLQRACNVESLFSPFPGGKVRHFAKRRRESAPRERRRKTLRLALHVRSSHRASNGWEEASSEEPDGRQKNRQREKKTRGGSEQGAWLNENSDEWHGTGGERCRRGRHNGRRWRRRQR